MKKKYSLLILLLVFIIPYIVKADVPTVDLEIYEGVVINSEGADIYQYEDDELTKYKHVEYDTKIEVYYEETIKDVKYSVGKIDGEGTDLFIKYDEILILEDEVQPTNKIVSKLPTKIPYRVAATEGLKMYKGPSIHYDEVGEIPSGTVGSYQYYVKNSYYVYVESGETKGWINYDKSQIYIKDRGSLITAGEIKLSCATVPPNTLLESPWYTDSESGNVLIEYKNCTELWYYKNGNVAELLETPEKKYLQRDLKLYNRIGGQTLVTIKEGEKVKVLSELYENKNTIDSDKPTTYYYVQYKDDKGWIEFEKGYLSNKQKEDEPDIGTGADIEDKPDEESPEEKALREEAERQKGVRQANADKKQKINNIISICVVAGIAISLGAVATIVFINKKKKKKQTIQPQEEIEVLDMNEKN